MSAPEARPGDGIGLHPVDDGTTVPARDVAPTTPVVDAAPALKPHQEPVRPKRILARTAWLLLAVLVVAAIWHSQLEWGRLVGLPAGMVEYTALMFGPPNLEVAPEAMAGMWDSIQMAWVGTVIAAVFSLPLSFLAAGNLVPVWVREPVRMLFNIIRALPELILAVLLLTITGLTPFTGALAIGIHSIGTLGKLGSEAIEDAPTGPIEAAEAVGASWLQKVRTAVWPSVAPQVLSVWLYRFEVNVRASAVLGLIGAGGIGALLNNYIGFRMFPEIGTLLIVLVVGTMLVDLASGTVRTKLVSGRWPWERSSRVR